MAAGQHQRLHKRGRGREQLRLLSQSHRALSLLRDVPSELGDRRVGAAAKPPRKIIDRQTLVPRQPLVLAELEPSFVECSAQALLVLLDEQRDLAAGHGAAEDEDQKGGVAEQAHA